MKNTDVHYPVRIHRPGRALAACQRARGKKRLAPKHWLFSEQLESLTCAQCRTISEAEL